MKIKHNPAGVWPYEITLNKQEWPNVYTGDPWWQRPIYLWVKQNCKLHVFSPQGWVVLHDECDRVQFELTWSQNS